MAKLSLHVIYTATTHALALGPKYGDGNYTVDGLTSKSA